MFFVPRENSRELERKSGQVRLKIKTCTLRSGRDAAILTGITATQAPFTGDKKKQKKLVNRFRNYAECRWAKSNSWPLGPDRNKVTYNPLKGRSSNSPLPLLPLTLAAPFFFFFFSSFCFRRVATESSSGVSCNR